jgi:formylglycine-generating enzyme required for sulfatase activity
MGDGDGCYGKMDSTLICLIVVFFGGKDIPAAETVINSLGMTFVYIQPGAFLMGSPESEAGREEDETCHWVHISRGFYISTTEVTQGQWRRLMGDNPSQYQELGDNGPVDQVSWYDCKEFIDALNRKEGTTAYRLPTEAEWEYACRAGTETAFIGGDISEVSCSLIDHLDQVAWYCGNSGFRPHRVGTRQSNAWGVFDMHGNVGEWCEDHCDWWNVWTRRVNVITDTYRNNIVDPLSGIGERRVFRGGSWNQSSQYARSADRGCFLPTLRRSDIGFRIVKME